MNTDRNSNISYERLLAYVRGELPDDISLEIELHLLTHPEDNAVVKGIIALRNKYSENELEVYHAAQRQKLQEFYQESEHEPALHATADTHKHMNGKTTLRKKQVGTLILPIPLKRESIISQPIAQLDAKAEQLEKELTSPKNSFPHFSEFNTMSESNTSINQAQEAEPRTISIPETNLSMLTPLDENEFLHQVLSRRKAASRIHNGESGYEEELGLKTSLAFESFPIVKHTLERIAWLNKRIGERKLGLSNGKVQDAIDHSLNGEVRLEKLPSNSDNQEIHQNYDGAENFQEWKKELIAKYVGDQKDQWVNFFSSSYSLQDELKDQEMYKANSGKFFWNSLGLGLIYVFCSFYLWAMISAFSFTHLLLALGYVFILCIFPDTWMEQLFAKNNSSQTAVSSNQEVPLTHNTPLSKSLFWVRLIVTFFLSLSLIYVSEGLPVWTEYFSYFLEYSPYWLMIWAMSFALLHFLPAYRRRTTEIYKNTITPYRRYKSYQRSLQHEKLMQLLEQADKWSLETLTEKERLRNERNDALFNGELVRRKRVFETQLERLGYLYDLGMGGEESTLNATFKRTRSRGKMPQGNSFHGD